jgi:ribose/xylose/arabinose/galactoside ABC-type transport system permease subunit
MPELGILALAMMIPLMSGGLNLQLSRRLIFLRWSWRRSLPRCWDPRARRKPLLDDRAGADGGLLTALVVGFITGMMVAFLGVHPILVTLGTMTAVKGIAVYATSGGVIGGFPPVILFLGNGTLLGFPVPMMIFFLCAMLVALIMNHAPFGVSVRMIGSNEKATRYSGVATEWMLVGVYVVSSVLCWVAAIVMMARFNSARRVRNPTCSSRSWRQCLVAWIPTAALVRSWG